MKTPTLLGIPIVVDEALGPGEFRILNVRKALEDPKLYNRVAAELEKRFPPPPGYCYPRKITLDEVS